MMKKKKMMMMKRTLLDLRCAKAPQVKSSANLQTPPRLVNQPGNFYSHLTSMKIFGNETAIRAANHRNSDARDRGKYPEKGLAHKSMKPKGFSAWGIQTGPFADC